MWPDRIRLQRGAELLLQRPHGRIRLERLARGDELFLRLPLLDPRRRLGRQLADFDLHADRFSEMAPEAVTLEEALVLIAERAAKGGKPARKTAAKKAPAKAAKAAPAKKPAAKKPAPKKAAKKA